MNNQLGTISKSFGLKLAIAPSSDISLRAGQHPAGYAMWAMSGLADSFYCEKRELWM